MNDNLTFFMDGPGEILITTTDFDPTDPELYKILCSSSIKSATISSSATLESVTGGRSMFARRKFQTERTANVEFSDCVMDFRYASLVQGEDIAVGAKTVPAFGADYRFSVPATPFTQVLPETPDADSLTIRWIATGVVAKPAAVAAEGVPSLAVATLTFVIADVGKEYEVMFTYQSAATTLNVPLKVTSLPKTVKVVHKQPTFDADNTKTGDQIIEFYKLQPSPEFSEDYQERAPYAPTLSFELLDPGRADQKVFDRYWIPVAAG